MQLDQIGRDRRDHLLNRRVRGIDHQGRCGFLPAKARRQIARLVQADMARARRKEHQAAEIGARRQGRLRCLAAV